VLPYEWGLRFMDVLSAAAKAAEMILGRSRQNREAIATYLDAIADDAAQLATIWRGLLDQEMRWQHRNTVEEVETPPFVDLMLRQAYDYFRLSAFYRQLTQVVGDKLTIQERDSIFYGIGALMRYREVARSVADETLRRALGLEKSPPPVDGQNYSLYKLVEAIQAEAAALATLAKSYRASS